MTEEHGPRELVKNAKRAEEAGFDFIGISDHYHPWLDAQGHSPNVWSVLGAIATNTNKIEIITAVTCPFIRYHPAIIAQAAATVSILSDGRFTLGLGAGELLNEHVVGKYWPSPKIRHEMLLESIDIIRLLWQGGVRSYQGKHLTLDRARVFDLPEKPPRIIVAIGGKGAAELAAKKGDGIIMTQPDSKLIEHWQNSGAIKKEPKYCIVPLCWAKTKEEAVDIAHKYVPWALSGWKVMSELPNTKNFEVAAKLVTKEEIAQNIPCGPDPETHLKSILRYIDSGCDHVILMGIGPDQEGFINFFEKELAPKLR